MIIVDLLNMYMDTLPSEDHGQVCEVRDNLWFLHETINKWSSLKTMSITWLFF
jgi:hypothetical protein